MVKKLNKKEREIFVKLESLHLMKADLKSSLASIEAQIAAYELQLQTIDPRKLINGKTWYNGIELYTFKRTTCKHKSVAVDLVQRYAIPQKVLNHVIEIWSNTNECLKTKLAQ